MHPGQTMQVKPREWSGATEAVSHFAPWGRFRLVAEEAQEVVPTKRTNKRPTSPRELEATSELWYPMRDKPSGASEFIAGG